jgi:hypothetical protein
MNDNEWMYFGYYIDCSVLAQSENGYNIFAQMYKWLDQKLIDSDWHYRVSLGDNRENFAYYFRNGEDAMAFKLKFL